MISNTLITDYFGKVQIVTDPLLGDGSDRKLYRVFPKGNKKKAVIFVQNNNQKENLNFFEIAAQLDENKIPVPKLLGRSKDQLNYLIEDLGSKNLAQEILTWKKDKSSKLILAYQNAIQLLIKLQNIDLGKYPKFYKNRSFSLKLLEKDMIYFQEQFLKRMGYTGHFIDGPKSDFVEINQCISRLVANVFVHRDFQSRNFMSKNNQLFLIDFQSAIKGNIYYDLVSMLYASYSGLDDTARETLIKYYLKVSNVDKSYEEFKEIFDLVLFTRRMRSLGSYTFLSMVKGHAHFMKNIGKTLDELLRVWKISPSLQAYPSLNKMISSLSNLSYPIPGSG